MTGKHSSTFFTFLLYTSRWEILTIWNASVIHILTRICRNLLFYWGGISIIIIATIIEDREQGVKHRRGGFVPSLAGRYLMASKMTIMCEMVRQPFQFILRPILPKYDKPENKSPQTLQVEIRWTGTDRLKWWWLSQQSQFPFKAAILTPFCYHLP